MVTPTWPAGIHRQRIIEYTQTNRPYGYDYHLVTGQMYDNRVESIWTTDAEVHKHSWGTEQILRMSIQNMPPQMRGAPIPREIRRRFVRKGMRASGHLFDVETTFTLIDGSSQKRTDQLVYDIDIDEMDLGEKEQKQVLEAIFEQGEPITKYAHGKRLI